ncbi:MAG: hypothetical protein ACKVY0_13880 [Prosthecobacter sp.]|uniref:hypothetical protein n=1 Tax=Prosthecobacter sp. TaxID=1965333 RepID=UPI0038FDC6B8
MSTQSAFHRGVHPLLELLLPGKEQAVLTVQPDRALHERIEELAAKSTEGDLTADERDEYAGYVQANKFVATLRRQARRMQSSTAS